MNDYFAGKLAGERQADYMREVEHDELVAQLHRAEAEADAPVGDRSAVSPPVHHRWRDLLGHLALSRLAAHSHRS
jgi:hypothetical protein